LTAVVEQYHDSVDALVAGDTEPVKAMFSRRDDVTLANPLAPPARGWEAVESATERAASQLHDGEPWSYETISAYASAELAYIAEIQSTRARAGDATERGRISLRVTMILRQEDGFWKVVHRHADTVTTSRLAESLLDK
jgi:ketosteroid isomerase-like protein